MRLLPRSLAGRLLALSAVTSCVALAVAAIGIAHVLERFVTRGLDQQLDTQVMMLARAVRPDGTLDRARVIDLPAFERGGRGWGWRVAGPAGAWQGGDPAIATRPPGPPPPDRQDRGPPGPPSDRGDLMAGEGRSASGEAVHLRALVLPTPAGPVGIAAGGPRRIVRAPLREAMVPLGVSLLILGLALALATVLQLRWGLRPLRTLQAALADVRAGRRRHVPDDQPDELAPLAAELNALVDQNAAQLEHARRHVANLAHGLKTPLAALSVRLEQSGVDPDGRLRATVADIDGRVRHHLGRARAAAPGGAPRTLTALAPAIAGLVAAMKGINADRAVTAMIEVDAGLTVAADPQDLDEMLGNLLDNAWRHARARVTVTARRSGAAIEIAIEDDGTGLSEAALAEALVPGRRLDERGDGHGFGLPIARELAELNGGGLAFAAPVPGRGLRVLLSLPAAAGSAAS